MSVVDRDHPYLYRTPKGRLFVALKAPDGRRASRSLGYDEASALRQYPKVLASLRVKLGLPLQPEVCAGCRRVGRRLSRHQATGLDVCRACLYELRALYNPRQGNHELRATMAQVREAREALAGLDAAVRRRVSR